MILIFGGTTEGRKALSVCEEAAKPFYYSTKGDKQKVDMVCGIHVVGAMDEAKMSSFCKEKDIKLIVNASHPFAENLHQTVATVAQKLKIPVLRLERSYPEHGDDSLWFDSYEDATSYLENQNINNLLALTGVNTIAKLKPYWQNHACWFRILDREESRAIVEKECFPMDKVLYYQKDNDELALYKNLKPEAIITKESGESGGFEDKAKAAKELGIPFLVVKRPPLSPNFIPIYGEYGLRRSIEKIVPDFFDLKTGYTTGSCATAASKAAFTTLITNEIQTEVSICLPNGEWLKIPIHSTKILDGSVACTVIKDAGDDPDVTHGREIVSTVAVNQEHKGVHFLQGEGVGRITLPGLDIPIGEPAINKTPRMMIKRELFKVMRHNQHKLPLGLKTGIDVTISVPEGEELAKKTFNPRLGIVGGISIIGTSGIVKPFSSDAFIGSIRREMQVAKALGCEHIVINSGAKSEKYVKERYPDLSNHAFIHYGNFIGETIKIASELGFKQLTMGIMLGKAVKLAEGFLDTHSKKVVMNKDFLIEIAKASECNQDVTEAIGRITMARQLWAIIPPSNHSYFKLICDRCLRVCSPLMPDGKLEILLIDEDGKIVQ